MSESMLSLMELRHKLREIYADHSPVIQAALKLVLALAVSIILNARLGMMRPLIWIPVAIIAAMISSALPWTGVTFLIGVLCIVDLHSLSMAVMLIFAVILVLVVFTYIAFRPKDSVILLLIPLLYMLKLTFVIPLVVGLACSMFSLVPLGYGVVATFFLSWVAQNTALLSSNSALSMRQQGIYILTGVINDPKFAITLVCCIATCAVVHVLRKVSIKHNWEIATATGAVVWIVITVVFSTMADVSVSLPNLFLEVVVGIMAAAVFQFFKFTVDYNSAVITQFEDEDYYYYVKAVPKMDVQPLDFQVKVIASLDEEETPEEE